jgi:ATP-dependent DNA helicase RecQ
LLDALVRAALLTLTAETFTNAEGNVIPYKKVSLTHEGREAVASGKIYAPDILLPNTDEDDSPTGKSKKSKYSKKSTRKSSREAPSAYGTSAKTPKRSTSGTMQPVAQNRPRAVVEKPIARPHPVEVAAELTDAQQQLDAALREWRKSESERIGLPQFFVLGSSTLRSIVLLRPRSIAQLQSISGIGPEKVDKFGSAILALCNA